MPSQEENLKRDMKKNKGARIARISTLVVAAYFLTCFLFSFRMNPAGRFFSTIETTPYSALFQGILFLVSLIFVFLFAYVFPEASVRLILLVSIQLYLAISAHRSGEPAFIVGALLIAVPVLFHGYAEVHGLRMSWNKEKSDEIRAATSDVVPFFLRSNNKAIRQSPSVVKENNLSAHDAFKKTKNSSLTNGRNGDKRDVAVQTVSSDPERAGKVNISSDNSKISTSDTPEKISNSIVFTRTNRRLFIVLCVLSAVIPLGFVTQQFFFRSSGDALTERMFFGTSALWLWIIGTPAGRLWIAALGAAIIGAFLYIPFKKGIGRKLSLERSPRLCVILFLLALIPAALLMIIMVARVSSFLSPTYDMGIFTQMFHNMKTTGAPITTLERDMPLSHFNIHMSPIFYVLLPFYAIAPSAETLQVLQILVVLSGVIPLDLLAKRYFRGSKAWRLAAAVLYVLQPGMLGSNLYDLHENCFLAPLTLWLIYACYTRRTVLVMLFTALTLMVKEDAALYVVAIALFVLFGGMSADNQYKRRKDYIHAAILLVGSLVYFIWVSAYLRNAGFGIMTYRFNNLFVYKELGVLGIIPAILQNPAYYLSTFWTMEKIAYLLVVLGSLGFLPLFQRKGAHYFLIIPLIVMNLSSNYTYQYDLRFQYNYGSGALLIFMAVMAVAGYSERVSIARSVPEKTSTSPLTRQGAIDRMSEAEVKSSPVDSEWVPVTHPSLGKMSRAVLLRQDEIEQASVVEDKSSQGERESKPLTIQSLRKMSRATLIRQEANEQVSVEKADNAYEVENVKTSGARSEQPRNKNDNGKRLPEQQISKPSQQGVMRRPGLRAPAFVSPVPAQSHKAPLSSDSLDEIERPFLRATPKTDDRADTQPIMDTQIKQPIRLARIEKSSATSRASYRQDENRVLAAGGFVRPQEVADKPTSGNDTVKAKQRNDKKAKTSKRSVIPEVHSASPRSVRLRRVLAFVVAFALLCAASQSLFLLSERKATILYEKLNRQKLTEVRRCLAMIPKEASVGATTFFTCYLGNRAEVYDLGYHRQSLQDGHLEYLVFDQRWYSFSADDIKEEALEFGYVQVIGTPEDVVILKWPGASD